MGVGEHWELPEAAVGPTDVPPHWVPPVERAAALWGLLLEPGWGRETGEAEMSFELAGLGARSGGVGPDNGARIADGSSVRAGCCAGTIS